jgi:competence protein ComEC
MVSGRQLLSVAVILLVVADPGCLFDVGAQLSFLAVLAIAAVRDWFLTHPIHSQTLTPDSTVVSPLWRSAVRHLSLLYAVMLAVWLVTTPLVAARFHVASVSALLLNVVISPYVGLLMLAGYSQLVLGMIWPGFADVLAPVVEGLLGSLLAIVSWVASWSVASVATPGPSEGWLAVFYLLLAPVLLMVHWPGWRAWSLRLAAVWIAVGLAWGHMTPRPRELVVNVTSIGHGLAVVVTLPNGATLVYDAGGSGRPSRVAEVLASAVWQERRSRVDCAILSHSDLDHCQALPSLMELLPVGAVVLPKAFLDFTQPVVADIVNAASSRKTPLRVLAAGQRIELDDEVGISILHPAPQREFSSDNAASLVVLLEYAGRRILLTGDLERDGLEAFLRQAPRPVDILLSPHHGSRRANTPDLARWARPDWVIASGFDNDLRTHLDTVYGGAPVLFTSEVGAVRVAIGESGDIVVRPYRESR